MGIPTSQQRTRHRTSYIKWFLSNLVQHEAMLEPNTPFALLGVDKFGKVVVLNAPTMHSTAALEQRQLLGYL